MKVIRINQGRIIPLQFRFAGSLFVLVAIAVGLGKLPYPYGIYLGILVSFLIPMLWSAYYLLEIDPDQKTISEKSWVMGYKSGKSVSYKEVDHIFINQTNTSQQMTSYGGHVHTARKKEYMAFLKVDSDRKYFMVSDKDESSLIKRVNPMAKRLGCEIKKNY